jgi:hypothetical protein
MDLRLEVAMEGPFLILLVIAHLQAVAVAWGLALLAGRGLPQLRRRLPPGANRRLMLAFGCYGLAALAESLDHTRTDWVYVNQLSLWNGVFFAALASGLALLAAAVRGGRRLHGLLLALVVASCLGYASVGKAGPIASQVLLLVVMLQLWWRCFRDWRLWLYPLFTVGLTTLFGALLNSSGDQIWHLFIGPSGSLSLLLLWLILRRAELAMEADRGEGDRRAGPPMGG